MMQTSSRTVAVVGSVNMDLVVAVERIPRPGETVLGGDCRTIPGGKGANQAVAAARAGARARMIGCVGDDAFGARLRASLADSGVDVAPLRQCAGPSGMALIAVDSSGENAIVVSPGANAKAAPGLEMESALEGVSVVLAQLEIPIETVEWAAGRAAVLGCRFMLNPAPARPIGPALARTTDVLICNETEAESLCGLGIGASAPEMARSQGLAAARALKAMGPRTAIVTLGERGVAWASEEGEGVLPAFRVDAVDTTAAGDAFCGALAARLAEGAALAEAIWFASAAGALAASRPGAQPSLPSREEIEAMARQECDGR